MADLYTKLGNKLFFSTLQQSADSSSRQLNKITPIQNVSLSTLKLSSNWCFKYAKSVGLYFLNLLLRIPPMYDSNIHESNDILTKQTQDTFGSIIKDYNIDHWKYPVDSDETLKTIIRQGIGSLLIEKDNNYDNGDTFVIDLSSMEQYEVRDGLDCYGGKLRFDKEFNLISIKYRGLTYTPQDKSWPQAKMIFRSSLITNAIVKWHAIKFHLFYGSNIASTLQQLEPNNFLRTFLTPFQFNNLNAATEATYVLFTGKVQFIRMFGFSSRGLDNFIRDSLDSTVHENFDSICYRLGDLVPNSPYFTDGLDLWNVIYDLVKSVVNNYYNEQSVNVFKQNLFKKSNNKVVINTKGDLTRFITEYIFISVGCHEVIGNDILKYTYYPNLCAFKLRWNNDISLMNADSQTYHQTILISVLTSLLRMPRLMEDLSSLFSNIYMKDQFVQFHTDLLTVCKSIDERNASRDEAFFGFHPDRLDVSMSA